MTTTKKPRDTVKSRKILSYMTYHPDATTEQIASKFNITKQYVYVMRHKIRKMANTLTPKTAITPIVKPAIVEKHFGIDIDKVTPTQTLGSKSRRLKSTCETLGLRS